MQHRAAQRSQHVPSDKLAFRKRTVPANHRCEKVRRADLCCSWKEIEEYYIDAIILFILILKKRIHLLENLTSKCSSAVDFFLDGGAANGVLPEEIQKQLNHFCGRLEQCTLCFWVGASQCGVMCFPQCMEFGQVWINRGASSVVCLCTSRKGHADEGFFGGTVVHVMKFCILWVMHEELLARKLSGVASEHEPIVVEALPPPSHRNRFLSDSHQSVIFSIRRVWWRS